MDQEEKKKRKKLEREENTKDMERNEVIRKKH